MILDFLGRWKPLKIGRLRIDWTLLVKQDIGRKGFSWNDRPTVTADRKQWKELTALTRKGCIGHTQVSQEDNMSHMLKFNKSEN